MKRKRIYIKPLNYIVPLRSSLMISGTNTVNDFTQGSDIMIGDSDDETPSNSARENIWEGWEEE